MKIESSSAWSQSESGFNSVAQTRLFYRVWQPKKERLDGERRALVFLHRGHEHSGRIESLVEPLACHEDWAFAWDARGHGHSPGERGDAPDFVTLVQDFDFFIQHIYYRYGISPSNMLIVANSVGAVIAATWLHDYAPKVRGVIMAAAAFDINLYVPLAKPALRLATCFKPDLFVSSYIRSSMLTHSSEQAKAYDQDPLITKNIAARVLLDLAHTAKRVVQDAAAIDTPVLMLVADKDFVVKRAPQKAFFERLSSSLKRYILLKECYHAIFYERDTGEAIEASRQFIEECFQQTPLSPQHYHQFDQHSYSAYRYETLKKGASSHFLKKAWYGVQRVMLGAIGSLSNGMKIGKQYGFDSGVSLDYVYRNQAGGALLIGKMIDRAYLDAIGWRGIRQRKMQLQQMLTALIVQHSSEEPLRILDVAAGSGRYVLETAKRFQSRALEITLRDFETYNLERAKTLADHLQLTALVEYQQRDAFDLASYPAEERPYDIIIVSGLYELFGENAMVLRSLQGVAQQLKNGGYLIYTGQPWHPQLDMIAHTLINHRGVPWLMRPRPQAEMDALVASVGCQKIASQVGIDGIFTVSVAQKNIALDKGD